MSFDRAFSLVIGHEGGYVNDPDDPGGETKYGISKRSYPNENIPAITLERAKELYLRDYWLRVRGNELPLPVALVVFDMAVNSGVATSIKALQRAIGAKEDGVLGPVTLDTLMRRSVKAIVVDLQAERVVLMASLKTWPKYGRGWARRVILMAVESLT